MFIKKLKPIFQIRNLKKMLGVGPLLLLLGFGIEGFTIISRRWVTFPIRLNSGTRLLLTIPCIVVCFLGLVWIHRLIAAIGINLSKGENALITAGPFSYVRHPLYSILIITIPPLLIIWFADLLFLIPWVIIIFVSHFVVLIEEQGLVDVYGEAYLEYRKNVPALFPNKGAAGKRLKKLKRG